MIPTPPMPDIVKKYGPYLVALVVAFAAGRYTMRSSVEKEYESKYQSQLTEQTTELTQKYEQKLRDQQEQLTSQFNEQLKKQSTVDTVTIKKPDGTTITQTHVKNTTTKTEDKTTQDDKSSHESDTQQSTTVTQDNKQQTVTQTVTSKETVTPPPSWRVYGAAALASPINRPSIEYGAGAMYDLGPVSVGGFGLYGTTSGQVTAGVTVGISF